MKICLIMESNDTICKHVELPAVPRKGETVYDGHDFEVLRVEYSTKVDWVAVFVEYQEYMQKELLVDHNWEYYT